MMSILCSWWSLRVLSALQKTGEEVDVAMKMMQPVDPGKNADKSLLQAYQVAPGGSTGHHQGAALGTTWG